MKHLHSLLIRSFLLLGLLSSLTLAAQVGREETPSPALAVYRQTKANARTLAARGDLAAAEQALEALGKAPAGSAARRFETALRLTQLADNLSRAGNISGARATASRALHQLTAALPLAGDPALRASLQRQIGFLNERYLGDEAAANAAYRTAAQLAPDEPALKEKLRFIEQTEAIRTRRQADGR